jgi:hypothetical protein
MHVNRVASLGEHRLDEPPDEATAKHEHLALRDALGSAKDARERLGVGADRVVDLVGELHPPPKRRDALGKAARLDRRCAELGAGGLVSGPALPALAARLVMDEHDASSLGGLGHDFMAEHRSLRRTADLLHVAPAEATRANSEDVWALGLPDLSLLGMSARVENDCPHRGVS